MTGLLTGGGERFLAFVQLLLDHVKLHLRIHPHLIQIFHLAGKTFHLTVEIRDSPLQCFPLLGLLLKLLFRLDLSLGHFLHEDLPDLHVRNVPILYDLLFDLFDKFRLHRLPVFLGELCHPPGICLQKALEHCIIRDEVCIHL